MFRPWRNCQAKAAEQKCNGATKMVSKGLQLHPKDQKDHWVTISNHFHFPEQVLAEKNDNKNRGSPRSHEPVNNIES